MALRIAVLGAGPGGYAAAVRAAQLGAEVTVVEQENVGGTCLNWGCIPSKVMITAAEMLERFRRAEEFGLRFDGRVAVDMQRLMERKEKVIREQTQGILDLFHQNNIRYIRGKGSIERKGLVIVMEEDTEIIEVTWDRLIVATGAQPSTLPALPFDGEKIFSSKEALCLREVPKSVMILGGGVIGCEFAFLLAALGSQVTLVEVLDRVLPLPSVDEDCSKVIQREMKKRKIKCMLRQSVESVEPSDGRLRVSMGASPLATDLKGKNSLSLDVDKIIVCVGRRPNTADMGLEKLGVNLDLKGWITVDKHLQTNISGVYAIGDVLGPSRAMLAHVASSEGLAAAENAVGGCRMMDYSVVPGAIFTMPEVANVGLSEAQARTQGLPVRTESVLFRNVGKAQVIGEIAGEAKIVSNAETGKVLGVHMVGPHATDLIAEGALAVKMGATVKDLAETIHAHPTLAEIIQEASRRLFNSS
jgi:dihydrolipoamide dehydrogenase